MIRKKYALTFVLIFCLIAVALGGYHAYAGASTQKLYVSVSNKKLVIKYGNKRIKSLSVEAGASFKFVKKSKKLSKLTYKSSNTKVLTVSKSGKVSVKKNTEGKTAKISLTSKYKEKTLKATLKVKVKSSQVSSTSSLTPASTSVPSSAYEIKGETMVLNQNGESINGVLYRPETSEEKLPAVILTHGFGGNYSYVTESYAKSFAEAGYVSYAYNLRNKSDMLNTSVLTEAATLNSVIDQIKELPYVDKNRIYLFGESQGGFDSAYVAAKREATTKDIAGLILFYPAFVLQDDAKMRHPNYQDAGYEYPETEMLMSNQVSGMYSRDALSFDIYDVIKDYEKDILIVHGDADSIVPLSYSEKANEVYKNSKLVVIPNAGHGFFGSAKEQATTEVIDYLKAY